MGVAEFYAVAAQVIPVLLIVAAIEQRIFDVYESVSYGRGFAIFVFVLLGVLVIAEALALWGTAEGTVFAGQSVIVSAGIVTAGGMVIAGIAWPWIGLARRGPDGHDRRKQQDSRSR